MEKTLPTIPAKRYFTISEVGDLCGVKPHVLRYWEQEFTQLRPVKRRGNRRYYQHHEVLMIRRIRDLLYEQGFTISGARNQLHDSIDAGQDPYPSVLSGFNDSELEPLEAQDSSIEWPETTIFGLDDESMLRKLELVRLELREIRELLSISSQ